MLKALFLLFPATLAANVQLFIDTVSSHVLDTFQGTLQNYRPISFSPLFLLQDLGFDVDDAGALAVAHHLSSLGYCDIIGVTHNTGFVKGVGGVDVIANWYNQTGHVLGAYTGAWGGSNSAQNAQDSYTTMLEGEYESDVQTFDQVMGALEAYKKSLGAAEDKSVTIASIGELTNLRDIVQDDPDLFMSKVKEIIYMVRREAERGARRQLALYLTCFPLASSIAGRRLQFWMR